MWQEERQESEGLYINLGITTVVWELGGVITFVLFC